MKSDTMTSFYCGTVRDGQAYMGCFISYVGRLSEKNRKKIASELEGWYGTDVVSLIHPNNLIGQRLIDRLEKLLIRQP